MTSALYTREACRAVMQTMVVSHHRIGRGVRRGRLRRPGDKAGELDPGHLRGVAPRGSSGVLARRESPVPAPSAMKNKVRELRAQKDLAQGQLAEAMGVSRQTINSIEKERYTPSLPLALALARFFGVTVEEMFDDQGL